MGPDSFFSNSMWIIPLGMMVLCIVLFRFGWFPGRSKSRPSAGQEAYSPSRGPEGALQILRERYAKGEITSAEFETMKNKL